MAYLVSGLILILFLMADIVRTTLTTRGEGLLSAFVSGAYRKRDMAARLERLSRFKSAFALCDSAPTLPLPPGDSSGPNPSALKGFSLNRKGSSRCYLAGYTSLPGYRY